MKKIFVLLTVTLLLFSGLHAQTPKGTYAIKNATVVPVSSPAIEGGAVIIQDGKITFVGTNPQIPAGAEVIDGEGLYVYPGMINAYTVLGLSEVGSVRETSDYREVGDFNSYLMASSAINPHSVHIKTARFNGITTALSVPVSGLIGGNAALINLDGWTVEEMLLKDPAGLTVSFPRSEPFSYYRDPTEEEKKKAAEKAEKQIKELKDFFEKAKIYKEAKEAYKKGEKKQAPPHDLQMEAMIPVLKQEIPVIISVSNEKDIIKAIEFVNDVKVKAIFADVDDGWKVADKLAKNKIPCIIGSVYSTPGSKDPYDAGYANAGILHKAGVKIAFMVSSASTSRDLPYQAGMSAAYGLPKEEALKAVTLNSAEIFGVDNLVGSLDTGKIANVVVADGDILEMRTHVKYLFIDGKKVSLESKQTRLWEVYKEKYGIR